LADRRCCPSDPTPSRLDCSWWPRAPTAASRSARPGCAPSSAITGRKPVCRQGIHTRCGTRSAPRWPRRGWICRRCRRCSVMRFSALVKWAESVPSSAPLAYIASSGAAPTYGPTLPEGVLADDGSRFAPAATEMIPRSALVRRSLCASEDSGPGFRRCRPVSSSRGNRERTCSTELRSGRPVGSSGGEGSRASARGGRATRYVGGIRRRT
jgi:hypothetical protein